MVVAVVGVMEVIGWYWKQGMDWRYGNWIENVKTRGGVQRETSR